MLNKQTCQICFQKNERMWDEEEWNLGYITCPKEELHISHKGKPVSTNHPYYKLFSAVFGNNETKQQPKHCPYQK